MKNWEERLSSPDVPFAEYYFSNNTRHFYLIAQPVRNYILDNLAIDAYGYNGITPGPVIVLKKGECVELTVENRLDEPTSLHVHGNQVAQGLMGAFIILPNDQEIDRVPDRDYILVLQEWEIPQPEMGKVFPGVYKPNKFDRNPNYFTINGKAFPNTGPLYTNYGETIRIRFVNKTSQSHSMHLHGHDFTIAEIDGFPRNQFDDTINIASGRRFDIQFTARNPGIWPLNGTKSFHQSNNGEAPGGMISRFVYI